jgi:hypothetical protein
MSTDNAILRALILKGVVQKHMMSASIQKEYEKEFSEAEQATRKREIAAVLNGENLPKNKTAKAAKRALQLTMGRESFVVPIEKMRKEMSKVSKVKGSPALEKAAKAAKALLKKTKDL